METQDTQEGVQEEVQSEEMQLITYEDFAKIDIRIGTIRAAELIPDTDKLIKCTVDFGELGERTIVSGIAQYYSPESLVGKQCPYVVNLEPRKLRGVVSEGMLFASSPNGDCSLLHPDTEVPPGTLTK